MFHLPSYIQDIYIHLPPFIDDLPIRKNGMFPGYVSCPPMGPAGGAFNLVAQRADLVVGDLDSMSASNDEINLGMVGDIW